MGEERMGSRALDVTDVLACCRAVPLPDAETIAECLTATYRRWDIQQDAKLVELTRAFIDHLGAGHDPLGQTCLEVAEHVTHWGGHSYHSDRHHAEVATNTMVITSIARRRGEVVRTRSRLLALTASIAHDLYYDPASTGMSPFELETISAQALDRVAQRCGVTTGDRDILNCLVLATYPGFRSDLREILAGRQARRSLPLPLSLIEQRPGLARLAAVVSDADLLSSVGLTERWHDVQRSRLEQEIGRSISAKDDAAFLDVVVGSRFLSPGAQYFDGNLARIGGAIRAAMDVEV